MAREPATAPRKTSATAPRKTSAAPTRKTSAAPARKTSATTTRKTSATTAPTLRAGRSGNSDEEQRNCKEPPHGHILRLLANKGCLTVKFGDDRISADYAVPARFTMRGTSIPEVLANGDHTAIRRWRRQAALAKTLRNRPDLLAHAPLTPEDRAFLATLGFFATYPNS